MKEKKKNREGKVGAAFQRRVVLLFHGVAPRWYFDHNALLDLGCLLKDYTYIYVLHCGHDSQRSGHPPHQTETILALPRSPEDL